MNLREDALKIWHAGLEAVRSDRLVRETLEKRPDLTQVPPGGRLIVIGAGKAGSGMLAGVEQFFDRRGSSRPSIVGWINVPDDCVRPNALVPLHGARPAGVNEPTEAGVTGTREILRLVETAGPLDVCLCLISGGGSALLPAPVEGVPLAEKLALTRFLSAAGATIEELNAVRKQISRIKGGGLARACRAGRLVSLIISDVLGDPLDVIASGPTVADGSTPEMALAVLDRFGARSLESISHVVRYLERKKPEPFSPGCSVENRIIGNNATAVSAAVREAERLGYSAAGESAEGSEGLAEEVGRQLASQALALRKQGGRRAFVSGGEPVVKLVEASRRGLGGRNQQLALAALLELGGEAERLAFVSAGTDGEDGPTDAAGAFFDETTAGRAAGAQLNGNDFLARNDAYRFFEQVGGLVKTGPTHTNVCDLRIVVSRPI